MAEHNDIGKLGESSAEQYLNDLRYKTICRNWKCAKGEIDLIVNNDETIVFVEVKTRSSNYWGEPETAISDSKIKRIVNAADCFLAEYDFDLDVRFDVISIIIKQDKPQIYHIEDAFVAPVN